MGFAGDGATLDIGLQSLSGMVERNENVVYVCYDNEAYMNTGIQGCSSTPLWASTTTTPSGKPTPSKELVRILAAHNIPYAATASVAYLTDLRRKVKGQRNGGAAVLRMCKLLPDGLAFIRLKLLNWPGRR